MGEVGSTGTVAGVLSRRGALGRIGRTMAAVGGLELSHQQTTLAQEATPAGAPSLSADFKVVLHAAQGQNWQFVLSNLTNLVQDWPRARIRLVVDGSAVSSLQGENLVTKELGKLVSDRLEVQVCPNALREHEIDPATIPAYAQTRIGGVVAIVLAQQEGFAYVKP